MRSTTRITWLLLSLSFLLPSVCSDDASTGATSVTKQAAAVTAGPSSDSKPVSTVPSGNPTVAATTAHSGGAGQGTKPTQAPTMPAAANPTPAIQKTATSIPNQPATTVPQVAVTNSPTVKPTTVSNVLTTVKIVATSAGIIDQPKTTLPSVPTHPPVTTPAPAIVPTPKAPVHPGTTVAFTPAVNPSNVGTSQSTGVSTGAPTLGPQLPAGTTATPKTSPDPSRGGINGTTAPVQSHTHTPSVAPGPAAGSTALAPNTASPPTKTPEAGTLEPKAVPTTSPTPITTTRPTTISLAPAQPKTFEYSLNKGHENKEEKDLVEVCKRLMVNMIDGNCTLTWRHHNGKVLFDCVEINGKVKTNLATQYYEDITKKPTDNKTLIAILASCGALLIMIVILAVCASHHRKPYNENQQHLTEELHTVENGYHDNPTLEVMEVQPEMQEKKMMSLNGEFNDSWIVPIDNLKEDMPDEEDTHL